jgi:D-glycero-D-manno-heptose 1,7-bisphosphate phosphatase
MSVGTNAAYFVFLDRDGTLIRHIPYLSDPAQVELLPTVAQGLRELLDSRCTLLLHTNQSGVGRGYFPLGQALACNEAMVRQIGLGPDVFADVCLAPEAPDEPISYRKPSPRYAREIMEREAADVSRLCYIGDNISDLETARNVGCNGVGVDTGGHHLSERLREQHLDRFPVFDRFIDCVRHILQHWRGAHGSA